MLVSKKGVEESMMRRKRFVEWRHSYFVNNVNHNSINYNTSVETCFCQQNLIWGEGERKSGLGRTKDGKETR
jgi:hypothetical protein